MSRAPTSIPYLQKVGSSLRDVEDVPKIPFMLQVSFIELAQTLSGAIHRDEHSVISAPCPVSKIERELWVSPLTKMVYAVQHAFSNWCSLPKLLLACEDGDAMCAMEKSRWFHGGCPERQYCEVNADERLDEILVSISHGVHIG